MGGSIVVNCVAVVDKIKMKSFSATFYLFGAYCSLLFFAVFGDWFFHVFECEIEKY